jgi:hypothetical protein
MGDSGSFMANPHLEICGFRHVLPFFLLSQPSFEPEDRGTLKIYDPYFCMGNVVKQLGSLGCSAIPSAWGGSQMHFPFFWGGVAGLIFEISFFVVLYP